MFILVKHDAQISIYCLIILLIHANVYLSLRYCYDKGVVLRHNKENLSANLDSTDEMTFFILFLHLFDKPDVGQTTVKTLKIEIRRKPNFVWIRNLFRNRFFVHILNCTILFVYNIEYIEYLYTVLNILNCQACSVARNRVSMEIHPRPREPQMENRRKKYFNLHATLHVSIGASASMILPSCSVYCCDSIEISSGRSVPVSYVFPHRGNTSRDASGRSQVNR